MATTWKLDATHSEIQFKVRHMMISTVTGHFNSFDAAVETEGDDFTTAKISFAAPIDSLSTNNEQRDTHLKSADFFDAANHPKLIFTSTAVEKDGNDYKITGDLTIRETTKQVVLNAEFGGIEKSPYGQIVAGFEITTKINRQEFGLTWGALTEAGGLVVANDVKIVVNVELIKQ